MSAPEIEPVDDDLNDVGNAERFATTYYGVIAWVPEVGTWRRWDGKHWRDDLDEALRLAAATARSWFEDVPREADAKRQRRVLHHAQRSCSANSLRAMLEIGKTLGMTVPQREWDADPFLLGVENGVIDLRTGELTTPTPRSRISRAIASRFEPDAKAPTWCAFLDRIFDGDLAMIAFLQRAVGYSLTGSTREQCLFICHGTGANGKSVFLRTLRDLLGDYGRDCPAETLLAKREGSIPNDIARLAGARLVCAVETEDGKRFAESLVKALTGGDTITARFLHREFFEFVPTFKLWLATNHRPTIRGDELAIWRRIRLIPFPVTIPEQEQDGDLARKLATERPGILRWALDGCLAWQRDGLRPPDPVRAATAEYRAEMDRLGQWLEERCIVTPTAKVQASFAFKDYQTWADSRGERAMTMTAFGRKLVERGFQKSKGRNVVYIGVGLVDSSATVSTVAGEIQVFPPARDRVREKGGNGLQPSQTLDDDAEGGDRDESRRPTT